MSEELEERINRMEKHFTDCINKIRYDKEERLNELENRFKKSTKKPYRCPVCEGQGGTFISGTMDEECNGCNASGIVWG